MITAQVTVKVLSWRKLPHRPAILSCLKGNKRKHKGLMEGERTSAGGLKARPQKIREVSRKGSSCDSNYRKTCTIEQVSLKDGVEKTERRSGNKNRERAD